jgi:hypothetical protein
MIAKNKAYAKSSFSNKIETYKTNATNTVIMPVPIVANTEIVSLTAETSLIQSYLGNFKLNDNPITEIYPENNNGIINNIIVSVTFVPRLIDNNVLLTNIDGT